MSDQNPQSGELPTPKKETVRITLPPKPGETPLVKRETIRLDQKGETMKIDLPGQEDESVKGATTKIELPSEAAVAKGDTSRIDLPAAPKKESTRIAPLLPGVAAGLTKPPGAGAPKPFIPPSAAPKVPGSLPTAPKPVSGAPLAPRAPGLGAKPTLPARPAAPGAIAAAAAASAPPAPLAPPPGMISTPKPAAAAPGEMVTMKAATPKKETSRISIPAASKAMPQATVKLQQSQPVAQAPAAAIRSSSTRAVMLQEESETDSTFTILSIVAVVAALASVATNFLAFNS